VCSDLGVGLFVSETAHTKGSYAVPLDKRLLETLRSLLFDFIPLLPALVQVCVALAGRKSPRQDGHTGRPARLPGRGPSSVLAAGARPAPQPEGLRGTHMGTGSGHTPPRAALHMATHPKCNTPVAGLHHTGHPWVSAGHLIACVGQSQPTQHHHVRQGRILERRMRVRGGSRLQMLQRRAPTSFSYLRM
jgi:hypothetical protein